MAHEMQKIKDRVTDLEGNFDGTNRIIKSINDNDDADERYEEARELVIEAQKASASLLQRRLCVGYARAMALLDSLESNGVISQLDEKGIRKVLIGK